MKTKKGILKELENLKNPTALNKVFTEDLKKTKEKTEEEKKDIKKEFGNDSDSSPQKGNIELSPARKKAEPVVFNTQEEVDRYRGSLAKQYLDDLIKPTNFNNVAKWEMQRFGIEKQYEEREQSPYFGKSYDELTRLRSGIDGDLRRGKITREEADKEKNTIDLWRVRTANKSELEEIRKEAEENKNYYLKAAGEALRTRTGYNRGLYSTDLADLKEKNQKDLEYNQDKLEVYSNLIAEIDGRLTDFEMEAEYDNTLLEFGEIAIKSGASDEYIPTKYAKESPKILVDPHDVINAYHNGNEKNIGEINQIYENNYDMLTKGELKLYNTLYNNNPEDARKYLQSLRTTLQKRKADEEVQMWSEFADKNMLTGTLASAISVGQNASSAIPSLIDNTLDLITKGKIDTNDPYSRNIRNSQTIRSTVSENWEKFGVVYNAGMSMIDNLVNIATFGGTGAASKLVAANLASNAASSGMISAAERGGNNFQIITSGLANGLAEYIFEKYSLDKVFDIKSARGIGNIIKTTLAQSGIEASEEIFTETANILTDAIIMQGKSENNEKLREYVMQGMSYEDASKKVLHDSITQIALAGASGFLAGGMMGGGATMLNNASRASYITREGERMIKNPQLFNKVLEVGIANNNGEAKYTAEILQEGMKIDSKQAGKVLSSIIEQSIENDGGMINIMQLIGTIEGRGSSYIGSMESIDTAKAVMHMVQGKATEVDNALLQRSDGATTLLTAIEGNEKAWSKVKEAAGRELAPQSEDIDNGTRYKYAEDVERGAKESGIGIEKPVEEYPYDTKKVIKDYIVSTNENLLEKAKKFRTDKNAEFERINLSQVSSKEVADIKRLTGADVSGYRHAINSTSLIHIENRHGQNGKHDTTMANLEDVARVEYVLENYDSVEVLKNEKGEAVYSKEFRDADNSPAPLLIYTKKINGTYYSAVAVAENSYKKMWVATAYISKNKEGITQELHDELSSLSTTSETNLASLPSNESVPQNETVVKDGEVYSQGKKVSIPEKARVVKGIVLNEESLEFRRKNPKGYKNVEMLAQDLGMRVMYVKGLTDSEGQALDGIITSEGIFINIETKNPSKFAATHEFSHRMKQASPETWQRYQDFVINRLKMDGRYYAVFDKKAAAYGNSNENYINEEIAADYIGELFSNEAELADFIRESRRDAVTIRDIWYSILDKLGLLEEKKKAQLMWRDAYREAVLNVKEGKVGEYRGNKNLYAGNRALTADNSLWRKAIKMQKDGASKENILKETGWFVGRDGKWRFEINDKDAVFNKEGVFDENRVGLFPPGVGVLKEVLQHEKLYEAYPDLEYMLVAFSKNMEDDVKGGVAGNKIIILNANREDSLIKATLIHEIQHVIQNIEGFSKGTMGEAIQKEDAQGLIIKEVRNRRDEILKSLSKEDRKLYDEYYKFQESLNFYPLMHDDENGDIEEYLRKRDVFDDLARRMKGKAWASKIKRYTQWLAHPDIYYETLYYNTAGEVEARDAASRISMKDSERRENFPYLGNENTILVEEMFDKNFQNNLLADREVSEQGKINTYDKSGSGEYTEQEYKDFGWARANNILNEGQNTDYRSKFAMAKSGHAKFPKTKNGEYIIPVSNIYDSYEEGINNVLVFAKGKIDKPIITSIIEIYEYEETEIDKIRRTIYELERRGIQQTTGGVIRRYYADSFEVKHYEEYIQSSRSNNDNRIGRGDSKETAENKGGAGVRKSVSGTRLSEIESSPAEESVDGTTDETNSQKFIKPGAEPRRDVKVPESVKEGTKVRQFARTAAEAETLSDETAEGVLENVEKGKFNYTPISNKNAMKNAYASLDAMGVEWVEKKVNGAISSHSLDKETVALAEVLMQRYSEEGQQEKVQKLIVDFAAEGTRMGQSIQAISMLKKLDKNYELAYIDKVVENLREEIIEKNNKKKFGKKHSADIEVSEELKAKLMEAKTEEEREAVREEIYTEIAAQLPDSWIDKWNAWRYMSMLGNARTHVRNMLGNAFFMPMIASKNIAAKIVEPIAGKVSGGKMERSKTFIVAKKYRQFAAEDALAMKKELQGGGKHNPADMIRDKKQIFDTKALEWMRVEVGESLEAEDWLFLKHHYKVALSNYLAANKIDLDNMSEATLDRARRIAIKEAQRNTYRDASAFANALSKFLKKNAATELLVEGLVPFKKTPVNVLKRGIEYSPAGLVKALTTDLYKVTKGDMTASEYIDRICCSLTGTGVVALGMLFKSLGLVSGASDDDKEKDFDELMGVQNYSLTIGGHSYTLDWLAPFSLPFFVGVEMQNIIEKGENINFRNGVEVLSNMAEPFFEMSMLQGLTGTVDTIKQANSSEIAGNVLWNIGTNYVGQAVPTLFGQIARTVDGTQRRSYDDKNVNVPSNIQYFVQGIMKKLPRLSQELEPYIDAWGRKNDAGNLLTNALQNMLSPGYYSGVDATPMENELKRLYGEVGNEDGMKIFPTAAVKKFNLSDGTEKNLTAKEYTKMQTEQGQTAYKLLTDIVASKKYRELDDFTKGKIVSKVYEIASAKGKKTVAGDTWNPNTKWISETLALMENGKYYEAETYIVEKGIEQVEEGRYEASKGSYKSEFNFDASKYSKAEIGIIENVQSDWAGYNASIDMGREIDESDYRHIKVYEEKLSDEMSIEEYAGVRAYAKKTAAMADGKENMKRDELHNYLESTEYSKNVKAALFDAIGNSSWINPYTGLKVNGEAPKKSGGSSSSGKSGSPKMTSVSSRAISSRGTTGTRGSSGTRGTSGTRGSR